MIQHDVKQFASDKIINQEHICRVAQWVKGANVAPITMEIDMTDSCNHKCPGCAGGREEGHMKRDFAKDVIKQVWELGVKGLIFTGGGEPLVHKGTPDMMKYAKGLGLDVGLITNGGLINEENADVITKNCTWVRVSLDASNADDFRRIHGMDSKGFEATLKGIRLLAESKKKNKLGVTVGVGYLTNESLLDGMEKATSIVKDLGADYIQFRPFHYDRTPIEAQIQKCLKYDDDKFKILWSRHKYDAMMKGNWGRDYEVCYGQQFASTIGATGKVYICCHFRGMKQYVVGDLHKNTLEEIWKSKKRKNVVKSIDFKDCPPLCRCHSFNQILWEIKKDKEHENFL